MELNTYEPEPTSKQTEPRLSGAEEWSSREAEKFIQSVKGWPKGDLGLPPPIIPEGSKISYRYLKESLNSIIDPYDQIRETDFVGAVCFHLRNLKLLDETKLDFNEEEPRLWGT